MSIYDKYPKMVEIRSTSPHNIIGRKISVSPQNLPFCSSSAREICDPSKRTSRPQKPTLRKPTGTKPSAVLSKKDFSKPRTSKSKTLRQKRKSCLHKRSTPDLLNIISSDSEGPFYQSIFQMEYPKQATAREAGENKENIQNNQIFKKKVKAKRKSVINKATKRKPLSVIETCSGRARKGTFRGDKSKAGTVVEEAISHRKTLKGKSKTNIIKNSINKKIAEPKDSKFKKGLKQIKQDSNISGKLTNNVHTSTPKLMEAIKKIYKEKYLNTKGFKTSRPNDASYEYSTRSNKNLDLEHENAPAEENKVWEYPLKKPVVKNSENPKISRRKLSRSSCSKSKKDLGMDFLEIKPKKSAKPK